MSAEQKKKGQAKKPAEEAKKTAKPRKPAKAKNKHSRDRVSRKKRFLTVFAQTGVIQHAVRQLGISRSAVQKWRREDPQFAEDFEHAIDDSNERMEREVIRRAVKGTLKPIFHHGVRCGHIREYSDGLLMFMLRARKPHVYRDNATVEHAGRIGVTHGGQVAVTVTIQEAVEAMEAKYGNDLEQLARSRLGVAVPGLSGAGNDGANALSGVHGSAAHRGNGSNGNGHHKGTNGTNGNGHH